MTGTRITKSSMQSMRSNEKRSIENSGNIARYGDRGETASDFPCCVNHTGVKWIEMWHVSSPHDGVTVSDNLEAIALFPL